MDSSSKINPTYPNKSSSKMVKKIHTMSWLKQDSSSKNSKTTHRAVDKDGKIISQKKTNEDYFPGTREEKKIKKKEKKGKSVVIANLEELVSLMQKNENKFELVTESNEIPISTQPIVQKDVEILTEINTNTTNSTVWSNTSSTADKLFPNVQSVRIDRLEEEEMLSRAIAESIASMQLEQFKRPSPEKGNRWEALYGDNEDEGGWDNVKRNLPAGLEAPKPTGEASGQTKDRDDNNNSSKPGILRNKPQNLRRCLIEAQDHEFRFKTSSEMSKDEIQTSQSIKSVSFNESIVVQVGSSESSENDESDNVLSDNKKLPYIDKFGRVDGYSERRLFMGKGARIKEQEYLRNQCSLGVGNVGNLNLDVNSKATAVIKDRKPTLTPTKHQQFEIPTPNLENPKSEMAVAVKNVHKIPESRHQEVELNSETTAISSTTSQGLKNVQFQEPVPNLENSKSEEAIIVENVHKIPETSYQKVEPNLEVNAVVNSEKSTLTTLQGPKNIHSQKPIPNLENPKSENTVAVENDHKIDETRYQKVEWNSKDVPRNVHAQKYIPNFKNPKTEKAIAVRNVYKISETRHQKVEPYSQMTASVKSGRPAATTPQSANNLQSQRFVPNFKNPRTEKGISAKNLHRASETSKWVKPDRHNNFERPNEPTKKSAGNKPSSKPLSLQRQNLKTENSNRYSNPKIDSRIEIEKPVTETKAASNSLENSSLSQREGISEIKDVKDFQGNIVSEDTLSKDFFKMLQTREEEPAESNGRCLVPTLVREEGYTPNFFITNLQYTDSISTMSDATFQSPACQNLLLAGVSCSDQSCDGQSFTPCYQAPQNLQYQNYLINDSDSQLLQSQNLNNSEDIQGTLPNYTDIEYAHVQHRFGAGYSPYQNVGISVNPYHYKVSNFMEREITVLPNTGIENSGPMRALKKLPAHERTGNNRMRFLTSQAPPGLLKNLRLPSGFTKKKEFTRKTNTDEKNPAINSPAVNQSSKKKFSPKKSFPQSRPQHSWKGNSKTVKTGRSPLKKEQNFYRPPPARFEREKSNSTENRKVPYPILGATKHLHETIRDSKSDESETDTSTKPGKDVVNNRPPNTSEYSTNNNNYLASSTQNVNSDLDREEITDTLENFNVISQSADPVICQMPDRLTPGLSNVANWQYNEYFIHPTQVPINLSPYYQLTVPNPHDFQANIPLDYFNTQMYTNEGFQQLSTQMMSPVDMPVYSIPHSMNTEVNDARNSNTNNNQIDKNTGVIFDNFDTSRGRGRFAQNFL